MERASTFRESWKEYFPTFCSFLSKSEPKREQICLDDQLNIVSILKQLRQQQSSLKVLFTKEQLVMLNHQLAAQTVAEAD